MKMKIFLSYARLFLSGVLFANGIPHFVNGISGNQFPSPFSDPAFFGPSSALINILWGLFNFILGYIVFVKPKSTLSRLVFLLGFIISSIALSIHFSNKL